MTMPSPMPVPVFIRIRKVILSGLKAVKLIIVLYYLLIR